MKPQMPQTRPQPCSWLSSLSRCQCPQPWSLTELQSHYSNSPGFLEASICSTGQSQGQKALSPSPLSTKTGQEGCGTSCHPRPDTLGQIPGALDDLRPGQAGKATGPQSELGLSMTDWSAQLAQVHTTGSHIPTSSHSTSFPACTPGRRLTWTWGWTKG